MTSRIAPAGLSIPKGSHSRVFSTLCLPFPHNLAWSGAVLHQGFTESASSGLPSPSPRISGAPTLWGRARSDSLCRPAGQRRQRSARRAQRSQAGLRPLSPQFRGRPRENCQPDGGTKGKVAAPSPARTPGLSIIPLGPILCYLGRLLPQGPTAAEDEAPSLPPSPLIRGPGAALRERLASYGGRKGGHPQGQ